jgi:hypothetical protein
MSPEKRREIMKRILLVATLAIAAAFAGGVVHASIPDSSGVIHGCYKNSNPAQGALTVIDTDLGQTCPSGTTALSWNQSGPQFAHVSTNYASQAGDFLVYAQCSTGYIPLSGGLYSNDLTSQMMESYPDFTNNRWYVRAYTYGSISVTAYAVCVKPTA